MSVEDDARRLADYVATYTERFGREPRCTPEFVPTQREHP